ncbi:MAG: hypothetical protein AVDCRST_MAG86-3447 [uncultured Truepera sp.]|uniref:NACHT domain-containing protein n=1 Tax=uncultured Truepera sp. TaxID=543023 RepID=A0A6J4VQ93_9DEIN|nr:MAG: hypothetical protein AVDCRST_MAG86-3447 [uncultured Truepera sp.]
MLGVAGVGKTRLALQLAHEQLSLGTFQDAVRFVSLDTLNDARQLPSRLIGDLGLTQRANTDPLEQLTTFIAKRRMLLVLDNFEGLVEGSSLLSQLLRVCPNLKVLVTTRERLRLEEEHVFPIEGLPYPGGRAADGPLADAVQLFKERAQQAHPHFDLERELAAVLDICRLVEGLPLGIELAASWVRLMPCTEIASEIRRSLEFLSSTTRNVPERHRSLEAAFEASWGRLSPQEQEGLRGLSVFRGGFTRAAASTMAGATIPLLASLVDRSLLRVSPSGRYDRHPLLYQFTREKLAEHPEEQAGAQGKHAAFYLSLAEEAAPQLRGREQVRWFGRLSEELDNFREALRVLETKGDAETALRLATTLGHLWSTRGHYAEGYSYLTRFLPEVARPSVTAAKASLLAADLAWVQGDHKTAQTLLEQSLTSAKELNEKSLWSRSLGALGRIAQLNRGDPEGARSLYEAALERAGEVGDKEASATSLRSLGGLHSEGANYRQARLCYEASASLAAELGDDHSRAKALVSLATVLTYLGESAQAHVLNEQCLELFRAVGDAHGAGIALLNLGVDASEQGDLEGSTERYRQSLELFRGLGDKRMVSHLLNNVAGVLQKCGDLPQAQELLEESLAIQRTVGDVSLVAHALNTLASVYDDQGRPGEAFRCYQECLELCRETNDTWALMRVLEASARWHLGRDNYGAAQTLLAEAVALAHASGDRKTLAKALEARAMLEAAAGEGARAVHLSAYAERLRQTLGFARLPRYQHDYEETLARARERLGEKRFKDAWAHGQVLTLEEAVRMCRAFAETPTARTPPKDTVAP